MLDNICILDPFCIVESIYVINVFSEFDSVFHISVCALVLPTSAEYLVMF